MARENEPAPPGRQRTLFAYQKMFDRKGEEIAKREGIDLATANAEAPGEVDPAMTALYYAAVREAYVTADDVHAVAAEMGDPIPANANFMGGLMPRGARAGWLEKTDRSIPSARKGRHASRVIMWKSRLYTRRRKAVTP
jgi:hypothetical protein